MYYYINGLAGGPVGKRYFNPIVFLYIAISNNGILIQ